MQLKEFIKSLPQGLDTLFSRRKTVVIVCSKKLLARSISKPKILFYEDPTDNMDDKVANEIIDYRQRTPMDHYCIIKNQYWKASVTEILL
jgi:ABC-type ATPase involved in cell division